MIGSIRQKTIVREGGWVEIRSPELPIGARVEVIVLVEPEDAEDPVNYTVVATDDL